MPDTDTATEKSAIPETSTESVASTDVKTSTDPKTSADLQTSADAQTSTDDVVAEVPSASPTSRSRLIIGGLAVLLVAAVVAIGVLTWQWRSTANDLAAVRASDRDAAQAITIAKDYTARSLTYDFNNLDAFFAGVQKGAAPQLVDRYRDVRSTLGGIMTQAQVVATGNVIAASVESHSGRSFVVDVFATQTTRNAQQKEPATVPNLLKVTVADTDSGWQVTDYGAR